MDAGSPGDDVAALIERSRGGDSDAARALFERLHGELRALAASVFRSQRAGHTLQPTALVHEAFVKMMGARDAPSPWQDESHFFAVAATAMRQILVNHARAKNAEKRGGKRGPGDRTLLLNDEIVGSPAGGSGAGGGFGNVDVLDLNDALEKLATIDPRKHRVVELRFFAGLTEDEVADVLGVSARTVRYDWIKAKGWLYRELSDAPKD